MALPQASGEHTDIVSQVNLGPRNLNRERPLVLLPEQQAVPPELLGNKLQPNATVPVLSAIPEKSPDLSEDKQNGILTQSLPNKPSPPSGFVGSCWWQGLKVGIPIFLGFIAPGVGFLFGALALGLASTSLNLFEKYYTKKTINKKDAIELTIDFATDFLGGSVIRFFRGGKTLLHALGRGFVGGALSGGISNGSAQLAKDMWMEEKVNREKLKETVLTGVISGGIFGALGNIFRFRFQNMYPPYPKLKHCYRPAQGPGRIRPPTAQAIPRQNPGAANPPGAGVQAHPPQNPGGAKHLGAQGMSPKIHPSDFKQGIREG